MCRGGVGTDRGTWRGQGKAAEQARACSESRARAHPKFLTAGQSPVSSSRTSTGSPPCRGSRGTTGRRSSSSRSHRGSRRRPPAAVGAARAGWARACTYVENKAAQTSASWLSGGPFQRQIVPQTAPSFGQPRPISRLGRAGRPYWPCFPHRRVPGRSRRQGHRRRRPGHEIKGRPLQQHQRERREQRAHAKRHEPAEHHRPAARLAWVGLGRLAALGGRSGGRSGGGRRGGTRRPLAGG
eukprot:scaffold48578_cov55-Phaeocystis_antarctica.AAC.1